MKLEELPFLQDQQKNDEGANVHHANLKTPWSEPKVLSGYKVDILHAHSKEHHQKKDDPLYFGKLQREKVTQGHSHKKS